MIKDSSINSDYNRRYITGDADMAILKLNHLMYIGDIQENQSVIRKCFSETQASNVQDNL